MPKINTKMGTGAALVIALLAFGAFAGAAALVTKNQFNFAAITSADEGEDDNNDDGEDEDKDEDKDDSEDEDKEDKKDEKAKEEAKKKAERARESAKKQAERSGTNSEDEDEDEADEVEDKDEDKNGDDEGMFKDRDKTLAKLQKEIAKAKENILKKQAEGTDVTAALARLALAEAGLAQVGSSFDANDLATAKTLAKQIKKTAHFTEKDLEFSKKVAEEMAKVEKRFGQVEKKIGELEGLGGDAAAFEFQLSTLRSDFSVLKASIAAAPGTITRDMVKAFEKRVKRLKSLVESTIFALGGTDDDDLFEDLDDVAEIEDGDDNGVSGKVRKIAAEHKAASKAIKESLEDIKDRGGLVRTLLGSDSDALAMLNKEVAGMNTRAAALELASKQVSDPDIKRILDAQISILKQEAGKLQSFITSQSEIKGIFGWFANFIPRF